MRLAVLPCRWRWSATAVFAVMALLAPAVQAQTLTASPARLTFIGSEGTERLPAERVDVLVADQGQTWRARGSAPWIVVSPDRGQGPGALSVRIVSRALAAGTHRGSVIIESTGARGTPASVEVLVILAKPRSQPQPAQPAAKPRQPPGAATTPATQKSAVQGAGGPLAFSSPRLPSAGMNVPYSAPVPVRGGRPPYTLQVVQGQLPPDLALMNGALTGIPRAPGTFAFSIAVTDSSDPPVTALQTFMLGVSVIDQNTGLMVRPTELAFTATGGRLPAPVTMTIASGGPPLTWRIASDAAWLKIQPISGVAPASLSVGVDVEGLAAGTYTATLTVTMDAAPNSPIAVPVRLTVR